MTLSKRAELLPASPIRKLAPLAAAAEEAGRRVYRLNIGQPDIRTPEEYFQGLHHFCHPVVEYEQSQGSDELRMAWSHYMNRTLGLATTPEDFLITVGSSEGLVFLFYCCCDPGDDVLVFDPTYANYISFAMQAEVHLTPVPTRIEENFRLPSREEIINALTPRTKAILLCSPNNPTGAVYGEESVKLLLEICEERNLFLLLDETYREFVYEGKKPYSVLHTYPQNKRVVVIDSLSKRFSLCGARLGAIITKNENILASVLKLGQARLSAPALEQFAAAYMLDHLPDTFLTDVRAEYESRRNTLYEALLAIPYIETHKPEGAFYTLVKLPVDDAEHFACYLLRDVNVNGTTTFLAPAEGFYVQKGRGKKEARIAYVLEKPFISAAIQVIGSALNSYNKK